jgi:hypothetical protein
MAEIRFRVEPQDTENPLLYADLYDDAGKFTLYVIVGPLAGVTPNELVRAMQGVVSARYHRLHSNEPE